VNDLLQMLSFTTAICLSFAIFMATVAVVSKLFDWLKL
jgi:hypothetical protein